MALVSIIFSQAYAADDIEFGTRFLPSNIVENSEAIIQVYAIQDENIIPKNISDLIATSLDSSIVRVVEVIEPDSGFITELKIATGDAGDTTITLAAPGFPSKEIPIEVFGNQLSQQQIILQTVPDTFSVESNSRGLVSIQLSDSDEFPVIANEDTIVTLSSSDYSVIDFAQKDLIIKKGEYYVIGEIIVKGEGMADIYATTKNLESVSEEITVEDEEELEIELFVFPETINAHTASLGHIIVQLQDSSGEPVIADEDIRVDLRITNDDFSESTNLSDDLYNSIKTVGYFEIKKGEYNGYTTFASLTGIEDTYDITISARDPFVVESETIDTVDLEFFDDKIVEFETIPILATGDRELIGIVYLEDDGADPIKASEDIFISIDSSDTEILDVEPVVIKKGESSKPVYAKVGNSVPEDIELFPRIEEADIVEPDVYGPDEESIELTVTPLVSEIAVGNTFPLAAYLVDGEKIAPFTKTSDLFISPSEYFEFEEKTINKGEKIFVFDAKSIKKGSEDINFNFENYDDSVDLDAVSSPVSDFELEYSESIFAGSNDIFSLQLISDSGLPVVASEDVTMQFVLNDDSVLEIPNTVIIEKGQHFTLFDVAAKTSGTAELSVLADEIPLQEFEIEVSSLEPEITISAPDLIDPDDFFDAMINVKLNDAALSDSKVSWNVDGGLVQLSDSKTGSDGDATISIIAIDPKSVKISADVSGSWYSPVSISKTVKINSTNSEFMAFAEDGQETQYGQIEIFGFDPVIIIVPLGIGLGAYYLKKKGMLKVTQTQ